jgi:hypothetical protein
MNIELALPLEDILVTQTFGVNYLSFYKDMGLIGHNGIDFKSHNAYCYAAISGTVLFSGQGQDGGECIMIVNDMGNESYGVLYYHLETRLVKTGDKVKMFDKIGVCDNTGKYTTGGHLHFELYYTMKNGIIKDRDNGYNGRINPAPYFKYSVNRKVLNSKDWDKSPAHHRYWQDKRDFAKEVKSLTYLIRSLKIMPTNEQVNAYTYGLWTLADISNPCMRELYSQKTKPQILKGEYPFKSY